MHLSRGFFSFSRKLFSLQSFIIPVQQQEKAALFAPPFLGFKSHIFSRTNFEYLAPVLFLLIFFQFFDCFFTYVQFGLVDFLFRF